MNRSAIVDQITEYTIYIYVVISMSCTSNNHLPLFTNSLIISSLYQVQTTAKKLGQYIGKPVECLNFSSTVCTHLCANC